MNPDAGETAALRPGGGRRAVALGRPPAMGGIYVKTLVPRPGRASSLEPVELRVDGVHIDADNLAAYQRLLGEPVTDTAPAGYLHALTFPLQMAVMTRRGFPLRALGMVHVANSVTQHRPVRLDEVLGLRAWAQDLRPHRSGTQVDLVSQALDDDGDVVWECTSTYLAKGAKDAGAKAAGAQSAGAPSAGTPSADESAASDPAPAGAPRTEFEAPEQTARWELAADTGRRYASITGDRNPIHVSALAARAFGFPRAIAHGMYTASRALAAVGPARGDAFTWDVVFATPVLLPSTVAVRVAPADVPDADDSATTRPARGRKARRAEAEHTELARTATTRFELAVWDPATGAPHLTGTLTPF